jgi:hypothetical protein
MAFADNNALTQYAPEVFDQGVADWTTDLATAEQDVSDMVQVRWYNNHKSRKDYSKAKLTESQWTKATVYRSLANYIMPKLSTFRPEGDPFANQIVFYKERFEEEMDLQFALGIQYDEDGDGSVTDAETHEYRQDRLYR